MKFTEWLKLPEAAKIEDLDKPAATCLHKQIIRGKGFLRRLYADWYGEFKKAAENSGAGALVEMGSGGGFLEEVIPGVITSDILFVQGIDINFSASDMPFKDGKVKAFFMLDVLHHINDPFVFFKELERCLSVGAKAVMIEPANTLWGRFIWKNFHHEAFDDSCGWKLAGNGPLSSANSAVPWIIFFRDKAIFEKEFPTLRINRRRFHTPFRYIVSGGVSMRQLLPTVFYDLIRLAEFVLSPLNRYLGMFLTIEIEKVK